MIKHVYFIVKPWWRHPFKKDRAYSRHPFLYLLVRKPFGGSWEHTEVVSQHWTWNQARKALRVIRLLLNVAAKREEGYPPTGTPH